ncbi:hypothetical protein D1AOALGA4SA_11462 [Olavius algarvensis Delta 1 endosymbiont]|nr:hypothetical protein D1AOALGA4SA_11462 [Olavius algarvensis Delta 1 endosymbiont]
MMQCRFIPTPVGNTIIVSSSWPVEPVHPHACGEHKAAPIEWRIFVGSSPRLWGTLGTGGVAHKQDRFIPTPVGNTGRSRCWSASSPVHPHACGEHGRVNTGSKVMSGSSPRLWGTPAVAGMPGTKNRFIPTPVGNTTSIKSFSVLYPVHPHACGEHEYSTRGRPLRRGSSPRLWGTPPVILKPGIYSRFIPTPVGNTHCDILLIYSVAVHPHACGEHVLSILGAFSKLGSSPRLWGTRSRSL